MTNEHVSPEPDATEVVPGVPTSVDDATDGDSPPEEIAATVQWLVDEKNMPLTGVDAQTGRPVQS